MYTPDELGPTIDGETGEVIDQPARVVTIEQPMPSAGPVQPDASAKTASGNGKTQPPTKTVTDGPVAGRPHWDSVDEAVLWGFDQGAFKAIQHSQNAYNKLRDEAKASDNPPKSAKEMFAQAIDLIVQVGWLNG